MPVLITHCPNCGTGKVVDGPEVPPVPAPGTHWRLTAPCAKCKTSDSFKFEVTTDKLGYDILCRTVPEG